MDPAADPLDPPAFFRFNISCNLFLLNDGSFLDGEAVDDEVLRGEDGAESVSDTVVDAVFDVGAVEDVDCD